MDWTELLFDFKGRVSRSEFWTFFLIMIGYALVAAIIRMIVGGGPILTFILGIPALYPWLAVATKRLHDRNKNADRAFLFVGVPATANLLGLLDLSSMSYLFFALWAAGIAVTIWSFVELGFLRGTIGDNQYGADPIVSWEDEAGGQTVKVTKTDAGGEPRQEIYYVAESNPETARLILRNAKGVPDEAVKAIGPLLHITIENLNLRPGDFVLAPRIH
jgi:uncharacterized membrane protein YhaH (DUF805 family)